MTNRSVVIGAILLLVLVTGAGTAIAAGVPVGESGDIQDSGDVAVDESLADANGTVEILVGLSSDESPTIDSLQTDSAGTREQFMATSSGLDGVSVENEFWISNSVLLSVDTDQVDPRTLASLDGVERLSRNVRWEVINQSSRSDGAATFSSQLYRSATAGSDQPITPSQQLAAVVPSIFPELPLPRETAGPIQQASTTAEPHASYSTTFGLEQINATGVWDQYGTRGENTTVTVLDTGIDASHPDLTLSNWANFSSNGSIVNSPPQDYADNGHGTHVSGTVAGGNASGKHIGVAPNTELHHGSVLQCRTGGCLISTASLIAGIEWAVENDADAVTMSLGVPGPVTDFVPAVRNAEAAGTVVIASAGNDGDGTDWSPANIYESIAVGASDSDRDITGFSSGDHIDTDQYWSFENGTPSNWPPEYVVPTIAAPGAAVYSSLPNNSYDRYYGTSMAAPHVAGATALVQSATARNVTPNGIERAFEVTAEKPDTWLTPEWERDTRYGSGIIDVPAAIDYLRAPSAAFSYNPFFPEPGDTITFDAGQSVGTNLTYNWTFGDGANGTGASATHSFTTEGTYNVTLTVTNESGVSASTIRTVSVAVRPLEPRWSHPTTVPIRHSPTVVNDTIVSGGVTGLVFNRSTGATDILPTREPVRTAPTIVNGTIYFGTDNEYVYAFDQDTRTLDWRTRTGDQVRSSPTASWGAVYAGSDDGTMYAFDANTGDVLWETAIGNQIRSSPTVVETEATASNRSALTVLVGSDDGTLYAFDGGTGKIRWQVDTGGQVRSSPTVAGDMAFVGSDNGSVYGVHLSNGTVSWRVQTATQVRSAPTAYNGTVFVGSDDTSVWAIDATDGTVEWSADTGGWVRGSPTVANDTVYVGSADGSMYAFDTTNGDQYWAQNLFAPIRAGPTIENGTVYVGTEAGIQALDANHSADSVDSRATLGTVGHTADWADQTPTAMFTVENPIPVVGDAVSLNATLAVGSIQAYAWDTTGNGIPDASGVTANPTFTTAGEYEISLTVTEPDGDTSTISAPISVVDLPILVGTNRSRDLDGDHRYRDIDGDGGVDIFDVQALFETYETPAAQDFAPLFDFDGDGTLTILDIQALFDGLVSGTA